MGLIVDNFAGGGGASTGIKLALGRDVDLAVNHSPQAIAMHTANHPTAKHFQEDVWKVDPVEATGGEPVDVAWFSPDCFPAGTMVLTREGYRPIEQIEEGDEVLTHNLRWRRVTATMSTARQILRLRGHGHPGLAVSAEHPFYARKRVDRWSKGRHGYDRTLEPEAWTRAGDLGPGWYWATPVRFPEAEVPAVPVYRGRTTSITADLLWLAGRYIADGWTRITSTRAELVITCGRHEVDGLRERLSAWGRKGTRSGSDEMAWHERTTGTAHQFATDHRGLVEWLRGHFGHGASEKLIPGWALGMSPENREALLSGYLSGDGWRGKNNGASVVECTTVSKALAFGIKSLAASLGSTVTVSLRVQNGNGLIQGRAINTLPSWGLRWRKDPDAAHRQTWRDNDLEWTPVREQVDDGEVAEVFNLSVEDDESYIAEGIVVHNCTHFSRAKGGKPRSKKTRALAWVVIRWARAVKPRVIVLENVEEFLTWGPVDNDGQPDKRRAGRTFRHWLGKLRAQGYRVEWRSLIAADFGAPTTRRRLFLIARCDGQPIVWPTPTHGRGRARPWRTAAEVIDWSVPCPSIFERKKPLADATLRRIAAGLQRYVLEAARPFIVPLTHHGERRVHPLDEPLPTVTAANRGELALVTPYISTQFGQSVGRDVTSPLPTITGGGMGHQALIAPTLVQTGYGEREGQAPRCLDLHKPLGTVVGEQKHALVTAFLAKHFGGPNGHATPGQSTEAPLGTVTAQDHHGVITAQLALSLDAPAHVDRSAEVRAFLVKYYGSDGSAQSQQQSLFDPLHTVTAKARFGLVTVHGVEYQITDIGMRMLTPRELFAAQGFPADYALEAPFGGRTLNKTEQIELAGNSVCPPVAEAIVRANCKVMSEEKAEVA